MIPQARGIHSKEALEKSAAANLLLVNFKGVAVLHLELVSNVSECVVAAITRRRARLRDPSSQARGKGTELSGCGEERSLPCQECHLAELAAPRRGIAQS